MRLALSDQARNLAWWFLMLVEHYFFCYGCGIFDKHFFANEYFAFPTHNDSFSDFEGGSSITHCNGLQV